MNLFFSGNQVKKKKKRKTDSNNQENANKRQFIARVTADYSLLWLPLAS